MDKVAFVLPPSDLHGIAVETLWAEQVGDGLYRLENSPFYACGVSYRDIVRVTPTVNGLEFQGVEQGGGHSTYRIILFDAAGNRAKENLGDVEEWLELQGLGCTFEGLGGWLYSVDVPADVDVQMVFRLLEAGATAGRWDFEEAHYGHKTRADEIKA